MTPLHLIELWDRCAALPAFARHSPQALPQQVVAAVDEELSGRRLGSRIRIALTAGNLIWDFRRDLAPPELRRALIQGELTLFWNEQDLGAVHFTTNRPREAADLQTTAWPNWELAPADLRKVLSDLLDDLRTLEKTQSDQTRAYRQLRTDAAQPFLPVKK